MEISSSNLTFQLSLVDVEALRSHEETVDSIVSSLAEAMRTQGIVRDPLIVDREEMVILDGMHRFNSLKLLNSRFAPCCLVDYDSPLIGVGAWFRLFVTNEPEATAEKLLAENDLHYSKCEIDPDNLHFDAETIILTRGGLHLSLPSSISPIDRARTAVRLEDLMVTKGHHVDYLSEQAALEQLKTGPVNLVICVPVFSRQQIREFGMRGTLLPHKITRHVIPSRPLRIDIPLNLLTDPTNSATEANRKLGNILAKRHADRKPPGSVVDGRRYEEELLVFAS